MADLVAKDADALVAPVRDGAKLALFKDHVPMEAVRALVRRGVRDLHLVTVPTGGMAADMLIGAGCVSVVETSGVTMGEYGQAPNFVRAVKAGTVRPVDATCPAVYTGLQAAEKGVPFIPMRGLVGTDIAANRDDYKLIDNPFQPGDRIMAIPAIQPDFALIHAPLADRAGNLYLGNASDLKTVIHAARATLATCEAFHDGDILADPLLAPAAISGFYVDAVALAPKGSWPIALPDRYDEDADAIRAYMAAASEGGMAAWLDANVMIRPAAAAE